eukprot:scaffold11531_cov157-Skeletonema_menzelii.AAC.1
MLTAIIIIIQRLLLSHQVANDFIPHTRLGRPAATAVGCEGHSVIFGCGGSAVPGEAEDWEGEGCCVLMYEMRAAYIIGDNRKLDLMVELSYELCEVRKICASFSIFCEQEKREAGKVAYLEVEVGQPKGQ